MRISVAHETRLVFSSPVRSAHIVSRLTPRSFESQYVLRWRVGADLDATLRPGEDAFGSVVHALSWHRPLASVTITAGGEVQTNDAVGVVRGAVEPLPAEMYLRASPFAQANGALRELAHARTGDVLERLHALMGAVHAGMTYEPGFGGEAPAAEVFALKRGGAADFAHVFVACARAVEIPARVVAGYRVDEASAVATEMFAWAEAYTPGLGWVAFDAVHDLCANDRYIRVAAGLDAKDAAPLRFWVNGGETTVTATLRVRQAEAQGQN